MERKETANADKYAASSFPDTLKTMIEENGYNSQTIFNVDENSLFWKKIPK